MKVLEMNSKEYDFLVIGGGVVGLTIGIELLKKNPHSKIGLLEKEGNVGLHASGRNSGVLHSGFYYAPDSLKAKLTMVGNSKMKEFAENRGLHIANTGKVVVAQNAAERKIIEMLHGRAVSNGVLTEVVSEKELRKIEPLARTVDIALWSPNTAVGNPAEFAAEFAKVFVEMGGDLLTQLEVESIKVGEVRTVSGAIGVNHIVNCAGLYADKFAKQMGFGAQYTMLPFMGLYWYAPALKGALKSHIYPTPDPRNPFLGVHLTTTVDGSVKAGPTAIPVLSREQYSLFKGLNLSEFVSISSSLTRFLNSSHHDVPGLLKSEIPKLSRAYLAKQAVRLTHGIDPKLFSKRGKPGIRAQLLDRKSNKLEMDFVIEGDEHSTHILNAVSPAWTSSISFAEYVVDLMKNNGASA